LEELQKRQACPANVVNYFVGQMIQVMSDNILDFYRCKQLVSFISISMMKAEE
jgi:hypothetical protein